MSWCEVDKCPSRICNGPHIDHDCNGMIVTLREDQSCAFCDKKGSELI